MWHILKLRLIFVNRIGNLLVLNVELMFVWCIDYTMGTAGPSSIDDLLNKKPSGKLIHDSRRLCMKEMIEINLINHKSKCVFDQFTRT